MGGACNAALKSSLQHVPFCPGGCNFVLIPARPRSDSEACHTSAEDSLRAYPSTGSHSARINEMLHADGALVGGGAKEAIAAAATVGHCVAGEVGY